MPWERPGSVYLDDECIEFNGDGREFAQMGKQLMVLRCFGLRVTDLSSVYGNGCLYVGSALLLVL